MPDFDPSTDGRLLRLTTPLGDDVLAPAALNADERVSGLFTVTVDALVPAAKESQVTAEALLGKSVTASIAGRKTAAGDVLEYTDELTPFNGIVTRLSVGARTKDVREFVLELSPWLWTLTQASDCCVYQNKTVQEVVSAVFDDFKSKRKVSAVDYRFDVKRTLTKLDYCVQYRETHFDFVSRLLEQEGLHYFFTHEDSKHTLVVTDDPSKNPNCERVHEFPLVSEAGNVGQDQDVLYSLSRSDAIRPGRAVQRDYHFQMADRELHATADGAKGGGNDEFELFDYPGEFAERFNEPDQRLGNVEKEGDALTKLRAAEASAMRAPAEGASTARTMRPGYVFQALDRDDKPIDGPRLLTAVAHAAVQDPPYRTDARRPDSPYSNTFSAVPHDKAEPFRPACLTPKRTIQGLQNAVVTGPSGEEIHTDKYGRVRVQFPWDRVGKKDEKSACWVRVAQTMAGPQWGGHFWPRIGQEVLVAFMEGDPDAPIVVGTVYNSQNMPPYAMPGGQTRSGLKTRSTPKGKAEEFNELRFEDKKGEEEIFLHAQKDLNEEVDNDHTETVEQNRSVTINKGDDALTLKEGNRTTDIKQGNRTVTLDQGDDKLTLKLGDRTVVLNAGSDSLDVKAGKRTVKAMQSIELTVGSSKIKIDPSGITLQAVKIAITGQAKTDVSSPMTTVTGSGVLTLGGALTKIG